MTDDRTIGLHSVPSAMGIPWILLIFAYLLVTHLTGWSDPRLQGIVLVPLAVIVMFAEFIKAAESSPGRFLLDLIMAQTVLALTIAFLCYLVAHGESLFIHHWLALGVVLGDAVICPFHSYRIAARAGWATPLG